MTGGAGESRPPLLVCLPGPQDRPPETLHHWATVHGVPVISDLRALAAYAPLGDLNGALTPLAL